MNDRVSLRYLAGAAATCGLAFAAGAAAAATMTFDTLELIDPPVTTYTENGITVTSGPASDQLLNVYPNFMDQDIYMVDAGADAPYLLTFTLSNLARFAAIDFDVSSRGRGVQTCQFEDFDLSCSDAAEFHDLLVKGYRETALVAEQLVDSVTDAGKIVLGPDFVDLTRLVVTMEPMSSTIYFLDLDYSSPPGTYSICIDFPCTQVNLDNVTLMESVVAPVPLPASGILAISGLAALIAAARRQRSPI